jgi:hypothetical protein
VHCWHIDVQTIKGIYRGELPGQIVYEVGHERVGFLGKWAMIEE